MSTLKQAIHDYLALRRALGFKLKKHSRFLDEFAAFLDRTGTSHITSQLALQWATEPQHIRQSEWASRLSVVRGFARHWSATDPATEISPEGLLPYRPSRAKPYLYSDDEIQQLLEAAKNMSATHSLQPRTYHCLVGLLGWRDSASPKRSICVAPMSIGQKASSQSTTPNSASRA